MRLTKKQKEELLPILQLAVQAKIDQWDAEREIESILGKEFGNMQDALSDISVTPNTGKDVTLSDVKDYVERLEEDGNV